MKGIFVTFRLWKKAFISSLLSSLAAFRSMEKNLALGCFFLNLISNERIFGFAARHVLQVSAAHLITVMSSAPALASSSWYSVGEARLLISEDGSARLHEATPARRRME